jgi:hypothetical protein
VTHPMPLRPYVSRTVELLERDGSEVRHVPCDSDIGLARCWDVRIGVGFKDDVAGAVLSFEDDPVVLVVVNAMVSHRLWEDAARILGEVHQNGDHSRPGLTEAGHAYWMTWVPMPDMWNDGVL